MPTPTWHGFSRLSLRYGYRKTPTCRAPSTMAIPALARADGNHLLASRESLTAKEGEGMALWRDKLFLVMSRNATPATEFFSVPGNRLVELGTQVVI